MRGLKKSPKKYSKNSNAACRGRQSYWTQFWCCFNPAVATRELTTHVPRFCFCDWRSVGQSWCLKWQHTRPQHWWTPQIQSWLQMLACEDPLQELDLVVLIWQLLPLEKGCTSSNHLKYFSIPETCFLSQIQTRSLRQHNSHGHCSTHNPSLQQHYFMHI